MGFRQSGDEQRGQDLYSASVKIFFKLQSQNGNNNPSPCVNQFRATVHQPNRDKRLHKIQQLMVEQIPSLRRYARALFGNRSQADDLVQDTLERAWAKRDRWRMGTNLRAWLFTIMHHLFINQIRRERLLVSYDESMETVAATHEETDMVEMRELRNAIASLPDDYREVLLLVAVEQLRYEEVAEILKIPIGTVMSRLSRARKQLRRIMTGEPSKVTLRSIK